MQKREAWRVPFCHFETPKRNTADRSCATVHAIYRVRGVHSFSSMAKIIRETRTITVKHGSWNGPGGTWLESRPTEHVRVELEIDIDGLFRDVGESAATNKSGKSVEAGGLIVARRVKG